MGITPEKWETVRALFHAVLELPPADRTRFLDQNCSDADIRHEVVMLLDGYENAGDFLSKGPLDSSVATLSVGQTLSHYRIVEKLGAGGMGEVYRARDIRLDREVAIKVLPADLSQNPDRRARLEREAKAISGLQHPYICVLHDIGRQDGVDFLVMEYLEGETLATRIKKGRLPIDEAIKIALAIASALGAAHSKGIVHRDVKPGNIMLTGTGAKLLDFGVAKYLQPLAADNATVATLVTSEAQVVGTLPYMSPEQLQGKGTDARTDIFAFGCVLYEMLTGQSAFQRESNIDTIAAVGREEPKRVSELRKDVPVKLEPIVRQCLRKNPEERYASMAEIERNLEDCRRELATLPLSGINLQVLFRESKRPRVAIPVLLGLLILGGFLGLWIYHSSRVRWAKDEAVPQIAQLIKETKLGDAYALALQAERYIPHDPMLIKFWPDISWSAPIKTTPEGALVYRKTYNAPRESWQFVGRSPIEGRRFPPSDSQWKFELNGYATVERASFPDDSISITMDKDSSVPPGMVHVELAASESAHANPVTLFGLPGFEGLPEVTLSDFWIDKYEVTNAEFKRFLDQGGYKKQEFWKFQFRKDGRSLSWTEAMKLFCDRTGRPGPANWVQGDYPSGEGEFPVTGVSWFEAAAYAEFVGKSLPTIYHWRAAASPADSPSLIPASNFSGSGPARVGIFQGMSWTGAYDLAGNVKEWVLNEAYSDKRFVMGGAWDEPTYMFNEADARDPFERSRNFGFRCAKYDQKGDVAKAANPITLQLRDYGREKPVSDQVFQVYKSLYSYDRLPLHALVKSTQQAEDWKLQKVEFDTAYGGERMTAYLFLPRKASPPFQTVVYFPGAGAIYVRSSTNSLSEIVEDFDFIIKSGRAVLFPVYKGTFERRDDYITYHHNTSSYRDHVIAWSKDLGRSIDYLETRPDIDHDKVAYAGFSMGAAMGSLLPTVESRIKVAVLVSPGFYLEKCFPEVDQMNFAPRMRVPVLMLNGRFDFIFPPGSSQEPMFRLLGTPSTQKRRVVYDTGHNIPRIQEIRETLDWLDRYLGPVN